MLKGNGITSYCMHKNIMNISLSLLRNVTSFMQLTCLVRMFYIPIIIIIMQIILCLINALQYETSNEGLLLVVNKMQYILFAFAIQLCTGSEDESISDSSNCCR